MNSVDYRFIRHLGTGGFGSTDLVEYNGEEVVLKRQKLDHKITYESCENEVKILMTSHSRYVTHFISKFVEEKNKCRYYCILMEYCKYQTLKQVLYELKKRKQYLSTEGVLKYFTDIIMGLKYLHSHNILHRDLKPGDFGLSKIVENVEDLQKSIKGTYLYMSPEIFNRRGYNSKADIWSLGCILYELCTVQYPFECSCSKNNKDEFLQLINIPFGALNKSIPSFYPIELYYIILKCLQINPEDRPSIDSVLNENIVQDFIKKDCGEFLFQLDTEEYDEIAEDYNRIDNYCSQSLRNVITYSHMFISIFDTLMNVQILHKTNEIRIFTLINYISLYIGRSLLLNPHAIPQQMVYQKLNTYQSCKGWETDERVIKLISYIIKFLYVHHYYDEGVAIVEELIKEKNVKEEDRNIWIQITRTPKEVNLD